MIARLVAILAVSLLPAAAGAQALQLISDAEAKLPSAGPQTSSRGVTRGPGVKLSTPDTVAKGAFAFKVDFEPRGGSKIDPASVKISYLKNPVVDLTDRLKASIKPTGIEVAQADAPAGEHPIRVTVRDDEGRQGTALITLTVK